MSCRNTTFPVLRDAIQCSLRYWKSGHVLSTTSSHSMHSRPWPRQFTAQCSPVQQDLDFVRFFPLLECFSYRVCIIACRWLHSSCVSQEPVHRAVATPTRPLVPLSRKQYIIAKLESQPMIDLLNPMTMCCRNLIPNSSSSGAGRGWKGDWGACATSSVYPVTALVFSYLVVCCSFV